MEPWRIPVVLQNKLCTLQCRPYQWFVCLPVIMADGSRHQCTLKSFLCTWHNEKGSYCWLLQVSRVGPHALPMCHAKLLTSCLSLPPCPFYCVSLNRQVLTCMWFALAPLSSSYSCTCDSLCLHLCLRLIRARVTRCALTSLAKEVSDGAVQPLSPHPTRLRVRWCQHGRQA